MVIVFSTDSLGRGGKERIFSILAVHLLNTGNQLFILTKRVDFRDNYLDEYQINVDSIVVYNGFRRFREQIKNIKPDVVISWDGISSAYNLFLYRLYSYKFINGSVRHGVRLLRFSHLFRSLICHLSPYVMANSAAGLRANNLKVGKKSFILYNGIDPKFRNRLSPTEKEVLREQVIPGYKNSPGLVFVSVANFVPYKDYFTILEALVRLNREQTFWYLIVGDGPMRTEIESMINNYSLQDKVILAGKTIKVAQYLFVSDIMIHSSRGEGTSNAILEAVYAGLPVIASNVGGVSETLYPDSSLLFNYKDSEQLYECLLKSGELSNSFKSDSADYLNHLRKFSIGTMVQRFQEILYRVITENSIE